MIEIFNMHLNASSPVKFIRLDENFVYCTNDMARSEHVLRQTTRRQKKKKHDFNKSGVEQRSLRESHPFSMCGDEMI